MIDLDEKALAAITNARALLDAMLAGGWEDVCVQGEEGDYFLAKQPGTPNPLMGATTTTLSVDATVAPAAAPATRPVTAPHVGTVLWLAPVGASHAEGDVVARLAVLDDAVEIVAPAAGIVAEHAAQVDGLAEYGVTLLVLNS